VQRLASTDLLNCQNLNVFISLTLCNTRLNF
jgi:hypothetical protein